MDDFASASMLRLLLRAIAAEGLAPPMALPEGARVPLQDKQHVVGWIMRAGGPTLLLRLAQQVRHIEGEPLYQALAGARDPHDFLARWQRMERYVHSAHRVLAHRCEDRSLWLEHMSPGGVPPSVAETVAVLGVWIGALLVTGVRDLRVEIAGHAVFGQGATGAWTQASVRLWCLRWAPAAHTRPAPAHRGEGALPQGGPWPWPDPAARLADWLARDPVNPPGAGEAAAALGLPLRTLQRRMARAGASFREVTGEVRVRQAAAWLAHGTPSLAEIGFLCGYADQAHFTREFTRRAGMPPSRYRAVAIGLQQGA